MKRWLSGIVALVCFLCLTVPVPAHAEENMVPNYEVKIDIDIEVWPVHSKSTGRTEYITEISLKEDTFDAAASSRKELMDILEEGILLHEDSLKTQKILDAYLK